MRSTLAREHWDQEIGLRGNQFGESVRSELRRTKMATRECIISLATERRDYAKGLERLRKSIERVGYRGEVLIWAPGSFPRDCPGPLEAPFAFKPFCFAEAASRGMESVLWLDSSCVAIRPLDAIFERLASKGHALFANHHHVVGEWASDAALEALGVPRGDAFEMREVNAAALGLNVTDPTAAAFLSAWLEAANAQIAFRGTREPLTSWDDYAATRWNRSHRVSAHPRVHGHRHDQTVAGVLAYRLGIELTTEGLEGHSTERHHPFRPSTAVVIDRDRGSRSAERAISELTELAARGEALQVAMERAEAAMAKRDWGGAIALWREVLTQFGDHAPQKAHRRLSQALRRHGDVIAAQAVLLERLNREPRSQGLQRELASLVEGGEERPRLRRLPLIPSAPLAKSQAEWERVARLWEELLGSGATPTPAMANGLAGALCQLGRFREAEEVLQRALAAGMDRRDIQSVFDSDALRTQFLGRFAQKAGGTTGRGFEEDRREWYRLAVGARRLRDASGLNAAVTAPSAIAGSGEGRWGNNIRQLGNTLAIAEELDVPRIYIPTTWYLEGDDPIYLRGHEIIQSDTPSPEERLVLRGRFLSRRALRTVAETESAFLLLAELRRFTVFRDREPLREDDLVIHIRSADVFQKGGENANYGQPPLAYYLTVLRQRPWRSVHLVYEDDANPVIDPLLDHLQGEGIEYTTVVTDLTSTIEYLLRAKTIVAGLGSFIPGIAGLSSNLLRLYTFEGRSSPGFDHWDAPPGGAQIDVIDDRGDYRRAVLSRNWENRSDQVKLMLHYPESALRVVPRQAARDLAASNL